jgi:hypothetical protein
MSKSKSPKRVFFVSLASSDSETTKERIFRLFASLFQCSRVAVSAMGGFVFGKSSKHKSDNFKAVARKMG